MKHNEIVGLTARPFHSEGRPAEFVRYQSQRAAFKFLADVLADNRGIGLLHGPESSGKTVLVEQFAEKLKADTAVAVLDGKRLTPVQLLSEILRQYGYSVKLDSADELLNMLKVFAIQQTRSRQAPVLILESFNHMYPSTLCVLCRLASLTMHNLFALRIILVGDRYYRRIIDSPSMKPVSQRMAGEFELGPLTQKETLFYLHAKLRAAGVEHPDDIFSVDDCDSLHSASGGWPGKLDEIATSMIDRTESPDPQEWSDPEVLPKLQVIPDPPESREPQEPQESQEPRETEEMPQLIVTHNGKLLKDIVLTSSRALIGRSEMSDIELDSEYVSRQHALLIRDQSAVIIIDLNSRNGTFVNSHRVMSKVLRDNDIISIGEHRIKTIYASGNPNLDIELPDLADTASMRNIVEAGQDSSTDTQPSEMSVMSHRR